MASYGSSSTEEPGQYPATAWTGYGLPVQSESTGAPGSSGGDSNVDAGGTNEPGQYPSRETFTGVALGGTGAPGTSGVGRTGGGGDSVTYSGTDFYKARDDTGQGVEQESATGAVGGPADWTQANAKSYGPGYNMPGVEGNTPTPDSGPYQPGSGQVRRGGFMNGQR